MDEDIAPPAKRHEDDRSASPKDRPEVDDEATQDTVEGDETAAQIPATPAQRAKERQERFKELQARQAHSRKQNRKETQLESQRQSVDPTVLNKLNRKHADASQKLLKADAAAEGEDFERKRAWDWTIEESEQWDKRMAKKEKHREDVAFQDFRQNARKVYKRQVKAMGEPDLEAYEQEKAQAVQRAVDDGSLELVEGENGELVAIDRDGRFYINNSSANFANSRPSKDKIDRLIGDLKKAEEARLKKRRDKGREPGEGDVTYINDNNKQFNQKLARFYNKVGSPVSLRSSWDYADNTVSVHHGHPRFLRTRHGDMRNVSLSYYYSARGTRLLLLRLEHTLPPGSVCKSLDLIDLYYPMHGMVIQCFNDSLTHNVSFERLCASGPHQWCQPSTCQRVCHCAHGCNTGKPHGNRPTRIVQHTRPYKNTPHLRKLGRDRALCLSLRGNVTLGQHRCAGRSTDVHKVPHACLARILRQSYR